MNKQELINWLKELNWEKEWIAVEQNDYESLIRYLNMAKKHNQDNRYQDFIDNTNKYLRKHKLKQYD